MVRVSIVGTGDHAHGLAHLYSINNPKWSENQLEVCKINYEEGGYFHDTSVPISSLQDVLAHADVIILCIPAHALKSFVFNHFSDLENKILVDPTNSIIPGEDLESILGSTRLRWVKAFNDIAAAENLLNKPGQKRKILAKMSSPYGDALYVVRKFAEVSMGMHVKTVPFEKFRHIAMHQNSLGDEWITAVFIMAVTFFVTEIYSVLRYNVHKGYDWFHLPIQVTNKAICWTALSGFAISQLPGLLARMFKLIYNNSLLSKPRWLRSFLSIRKHLGLLSLWFLGIHIVMSLLLFSPAYYGKFFIEPKDGVTKLNAIGEHSMLFGILGAAIYFILGICSVPSVAGEMTSRQWQLVFGPLAWIALIFGTLHVTIMGAKGWGDRGSWPGGMPPITMVAVIIPLGVLSLKVFQVVVQQTTVLIDKWTAPGDRHHAEEKNFSESILAADDKDAVAVLDA